MSQELRIIDDWYELTRHLSDRIEKFPRMHRFALGSELAKQCLGILAELIRAKFMPAGAPKADALRTINVELEVLRFHLRLAHDVKALPHDAHRHAIDRLHAVGLQVGGWIRAVAGKEAK